jgi:hypothetical protein
VQARMERVRKTQNYAGIEGTRVNCIKFNSLQDLRNYWVDTWYTADDRPAGWDEDIEATVEDLSSVPQFPKSEEEED